MATVYYPSFAVVLIDSIGRRVPLGLTDVDAYNVTATASEGTVTTDAFGIIAEGSFTANAGDVVEFTVAGYTGTLRFTLESTQELAYSNDANIAMTLVVENLYTTTNESKLADVYITDNVDPTVPPQKIGQVKAGETAVIPYIATAQKNLKVHLVSISTKGQQSVTEFYRSTETYNITVPAPAGTKFDVLFDEFGDAATAGTARETLYQYSMPTGILDHTGDKITAEYAGVFAANGNSKRVYVSFAGTDILDSGALTENATHWHAKITIVRASNTVARVIGDFASGAYKAPLYTAVSALDLDANGYDLELDGHTSAAAGDITAKMGYGLLIPRKPQTAFGADLQGFRLRFAAGSILTQSNQLEAGGFRLKFRAGDAQHYTFTSDPPDDPWEWEPIE